MKDRKAEIETQVKKAIADFQERNVGTSVRFFVTYSEKGQSYAFSYGGGDYYSQMGYVADWLEQQKARTWHEANRGEREDEAEAF